MKRSRYVITIALVTLALAGGAASSLYAEDEGGNWIVTKKAEEVGYDFSGYAPDNQLKYSIDEEEVKLERPALRRDNEIWVPIRDLVQGIGLVFIKVDDKTFSLIRYDGTPLEARAGERIVNMNKSPFLTVDQPPEVYFGEFYIAADSLAKMLDLFYTYNAVTNTAEFSKGQPAEEFSTFSLPKPVVPPEERREVLLEVKPLPPVDIREEILPPGYSRDVDLKLDTTLSYLKDEAAHDRTRQSDFYLSGKAYGYDVDGHVRMRDIRATDKQRFKEDGEYLSLEKDNLRMEFLDNYITIPQLRSQSQYYFGVKAIATNDPFKSTLIFGETDNTVSGPASVGAVRYYGNIYALKQDYADVNDLFKASGMLILQNTWAELDSKSGTTTYPRRSAVYLLDTTTYLYPNAKLFYTYAISDYVPDNKVNNNFVDDNWRIGFTLDEKLYSFKTAYEHVGQQYASIGIPSVYQDYEGWDFMTAFKLAPNLQTSLGGRISKNNVERNPRKQTTFDRSLNSNTSLLLPWQQSLNLSHTVTETTTKGGDIDLSGNRYKDYRIDYTKAWTNTTLQLSYDYYILEPFGTATGGSFTDSYSGTIFQFFPNFNNSFLRVYQDMRKTKTLADASFTTTNWNTDIGGRLNFTNYLSASSDVRIATTQKETVSDTALVTLRLGGEFKSSPVTTWNLDYTLSDYDLYDSKNQTTKHYTILFKVRHIFDIETPEKWGIARVFVYNDSNSNGKYDAGEKGIPDIRANIVNGRSAITDSNGVALIKKVVPGERNIKIDLSNLPIDMAVRGDTPVKSITVKSFKTATAEFPIVKTGKIRGRAYADLDKNGKYDKTVDEPMQNVLVYLLPSKKETLTFSDGSYYFDYVYPGDHEVVIDATMAPAGYRLTSSEKITVTLKGGETITGLDFLFSPRPITIEEIETE